MKIMESSRAEMKNRNEKQEGRDKKQEWKTGLKNSRRTEIKSRNKMWPLTGQNRYK